MNSGNRWVVLNGIGVSLGSALSLLMLSLSPWLSHSLPVLFGIMGFSTSLGFFQGLAFLPGRRLFLRWFVVTSIAAFVGLLVALPLCLLPLVLLSSMTRSTFAAMLALPIYGAMVLSFTGFLASSWQVRAAGRTIPHAPVWIRSNALAFAAGGALMVLLVPLSTAAMPTILASSASGAAFAGYAGLLAGALVGRITKSGFLEVIAAGDVSD